MRLHLLSLLLPVCNYLEWNNLLREMNFCDHFGSKRMNKWIFQFKIIKKLVPLNKVSGSVNLMSVLMNSHHFCTAIDAIIYNHNDIHWNLSIVDMTPLLKKAFLALSYYWMVPKNEWKHGYILGVNLLTVDRKQRKPFCSGHHFEVPISTADNYCKQ